MKCAVNPLISPPGTYLFQAHLGRGGGLFNFAKTIVSIFLKEPTKRSGKVQVQEVGGHAAEDQKQIRTSIPYQSIRSFTVW